MTPLGPGLQHLLGMDEVQTLHSENTFPDKGHFHPALRDLHWIYRGGHAPLANSSWDRSISSQTHTVWGCTCTLPPESHLTLAQGNLAVYTQRKNGYPLLQWRPQMEWQMGWKREEGRGEWALRALLWSCSKLDKVQGFRVWAWLSWQCGDMCLRNRRRVEGLFKLAR